MKLFCIFCGVEVRTSMLRHWKQRHPDQLVVVMLELDRALSKLTSKEG